MHWKRYRNKIVVVRDTPRKSFVGRKEDEQKDGGQQFDAEGNYIIHEGALIQKEKECNYLSDLVDEEIKLQQIVLIKDGLEGLSFVEEVCVRQMEVNGALCAVSFGVKVELEAIEVAFKCRLLQSKEPSFIVQYVKYCVKSVQPVKKVCVQVLE